MAQAHRSLDLQSSGTAHQNPISRSLRPQDLEREPSRWPLQTVDDNAAASRCFTGSHARTKASHEPEHFGHHSSAIDRSFHSTYHAPLRPRRGLNDPPFSRDPTSCSLEEDQLAHERRIRSYRDTTSEIISLYASRNTMTQSSALVRHEDDASSTASHSRYPAGQRHAQSGSTHLRNASWQKSRTPGPYPTRLRRPGTGITSPTMTEPRGREYSIVAEGERGRHVCSILGDDVANIC